MSGGRGARGTGWFIYRGLRQVSYGLIRAASCLAPRTVRADWRAEWKAELDDRWARSEASRAASRKELRLVARAAGALVHVLHLRLAEWRFDLVGLDLRYAFRGLRKRPLFTGVVVAAIALGVGATTAVFSVLYGVVLRPLPYAHPERLVMVWEHNLPRGVLTNVASGSNYVTWLEENTVFEDLAATTWWDATVTGLDEPERVGVVAASPSLFRMLGVDARLGRVLTTADETDDSRPVLLGYGYWQRRFGGDPHIVGRTLLVNGRESVVAGVLPEGFRLELPVSFNVTGTQDLWVPQPPLAELREGRGRWLQVIGRLAPGVPVDEAQAEMSVLASRLADEDPDYMKGWTVNVVPLHTQLVGEVRTPLFVLLGAVGLVLLIACANVANLLLSRTTARLPEIAMRSALGASRPRLLRQLLTECTLLAVGGGALGLLLAWLIVRALLSLGPDLPRLADVALHGPIVGFALAVSLLTGLAFGLVPALHAARSDPATALRGSSSRAGIGRGVQRARNALVVAEIALSLMLLVGSGLLIRSFARVTEIGVGFDTAGLVSAQLSLPASRYSDTRDRVQFYEELVGRVQSLPGVAQASAITFLPLAGQGSATSFWVNDRPVPEPGQLPAADIRWLHRDYHRTMGIPLLAGRLFDESDGPDAPLVVIVSRALAERFWPDGGAVGQTLSMPWGDTLVAEIVGVVGDVRHNGPDKTPREKIYWHHVQFQEFNTMTIVARTTGDPLDHVAAMRAEVEAMDPDLPLFNVRTMDARFSEAVAQRRFIMLALGVFATIAALLACVGVFGVMSYLVSQRTHEIGVRMALGANARTVASQILRKALWLIGLATAIGGAGALLLSRVMRSMVFEVSTIDPLTLAAATVLLAGVAVASSLWPALRAARVDPVRALRFE
jgi:putative ABC transport system permease protein